MAPRGNRTPVAPWKGACPRPLDDRGAKNARLGFKKLAATLPCRAFGLECRIVTANMAGNLPGVPRAVKKNSEIFLVAIENQVSLGLGLHLQEIAMALPGLTPDELDCLFGDWPSKDEYEAMWRGEAAGHRAAKVRFATQRALNLEAEHFVGRLVDALYHDYELNGG